MNLFLNETFALLISTALKYTSIVSNKMFKLHLVVLDISYLNINPNFAMGG